MAISTILWLVDFLAQYFLFVLLSLVPAIYWYSTRNFNYWSKCGIKSPPASPFIGSFYSRSIPFGQLYQQYVQQYGKYFGIYQGNKPTLVIADPELIKRILVKDFHLLRNRPAEPSIHRVLSQNLVNPRDETWKRICSMLTPMFTTLKFKKMEDKIDSCVDALLCSFDKMAKSGQTFEARDPMGNFTMDVISKSAFATETDAHNDQDSPFLRNAKGVFLFRQIRFLAMLLIPVFIQRWLMN